MLDQDQKAEILADQALEAPTVFYLVQEERGGKGEAALHQDQEVEKEVQNLKEIIAESNHDLVVKKE